MAFQIYSAIPNNIVAVQIDMQGGFDVVGNINHQKTVNLGFAQVHVTGNNLQQAARLLGLENGDVVRVDLNGNQVVLTVE